MDGTSAPRSVGIAALSPIWLCGLTWGAGAFWLVGRTLVELAGSWGEVAAGAAGLAGVLVLHALIVARVVKHRRVPWWTVGAQAVLTWAPLWVWGEGWAPVGCLLAGGLFVLADRTRAWWPLAAALGCGPVLALAPGPLSPWVAGVPVAGLAEYALIILAMRTHCLGAVRGQQVGEAVQQERRRLTRDLHDLVGHRLTVLVLKIELLQRLVASAGDAKVAAAVAEALELVRGVTGDVRSVAHGLRLPSLEAELNSARSVLESAGVSCRVRMSCEEVPRPVSEVLTHVLREGVTNILRHTSAKECAIWLSEREGTFHLSMVNDGARSAGPAGHGLLNLREKVAEAGGRFEATRLPHAVFWISTHITHQHV
ncbi:sensor histidine kinase [Nonomuraea sp. NPDC050328]|uniref:sensor histidine kinase n=1 Tax=Nonomuraea sp. NPDC050328 TaxID=3364361 RepID=UPI00379F66C6